MNQLVLVANVEGKMQKKWNRILLGYTRLAG
jgi:hypothetical protein